MSLKSFKEKCRLCLESTLNSFHIKDVSSLIEAAGIKVYILIAMRKKSNNFIFQIEESKYLAFSVCLRCFQKLEAFQNFKREIESNQEYLNSLFQENSLDTNEDQKINPDFPKYYKFQNLQTIFHCQSFLLLARNARFATKVSLKREKFLST